jgi:tetratricopeptide (TPR) repeat protein
MADLILHYFWPVVITGCALCVIWSIVRSLREEKQQAKEPEFAKRQQRATRLYFDGKYNSALRELRELLPPQEQLLGPEDPRTLFTREALGAVLVAKGQYREAKAESFRVLEAKTRLMGDNHGEVLLALIAHIATLLTCGEFHEAERLALHALPTFEKNLDTHPPHLLLLREVLGGALAGQKRYSHALAALEAVFAQLEGLRSSHEDAACQLQDLHLRILQVKLRLHRHAEVESESRSLLKTFQDSEGNKFPHISATTLLLAGSLSGLGRTAEAEALFRDMIRQLERQLGSSHPETLSGLHGLAECLQKNGRIPEAHPLAERALEGRKEALGESHPDTLESQKLLDALHAS